MKYIIALVMMVELGLLVAACDDDGGTPADGTPGATTGPTAEPDDDGGSGDGGGAEDGDGVPSPVQAKGLLADDIPVSHTPDGGWKGELPPRSLVGCAEPLADGVPDMRGLWKAHAVEVNGEPTNDVRHLERIEQCGDRIVITAGSVIHDMRTDGTLENGVNDVSGFNGQPIHVAASWEGDKHVLRPNGGEIAVTRQLDGDDLIWTIVPLTRVTHMRRIPESDDQTS